MALAPLIESGAAVVDIYIVEGSGRLLSEMQSSAELNATLGGEARFVPYGTLTYAAGGFVVNSAPPIAYVNGLRQISSSVHAGDGFGVVVGAGQAILAIVPLALKVSSAPAGRILVLPREKAANLADYQRAARDGTLVRTDPSTVRGSGFRRRLTTDRGGPPGSGYDADHIIELCVGGRDCAATNGQWLQSGANRASGAKLGQSVRSDPLGTRYTRVEVELQ